MSTPACAPSWRAHMPAQLTTYSRLDVPGGRPHAGDRAPRLQEPGDRHALDDRHPELARALGQRHRDVDRVGPAVLGHVEAGQDVVGAGQREQLADLTGRDLLHVDAAPPVERGHPPVLLQPVGVGRHLDEAHRLEAGRQPGLGLQAGVEVAGVLPHLGRGLGRRTEGDDQPGRVPGRARGELVALQQDDVRPPHVREVVGDRAADDATPDHDDLGALG